MQVRDLKYSMVRRIFQFLLQIILLPISVLEFVLSVGFPLCPLVVCIIIWCSSGSIMDSPFLMVMASWGVVSLFLCLFLYDVNVKFYEIHLKFKRLKFSDGTSTSYGTHYVNKEVKKDIKDLTGHYVGEIVSNERVEQENWEYDASDDEKIAPYFCSFALFLRLISIFLAFIACFNNRIKISYVKPKELEKYDEKKYVFLDILLTQKEKGKIKKNNI